MGTPIRGNDTGRTSRAILSAVWMFGGRGIGLAWSLMVIGYLGSHAFGQFAIGIAAASLISIPIDAYYLVRSPRVDDRQFPTDRASRWWIGVVVFTTGLVLLPFWFYGGLALSKAGGDIYFNAQKSTSIRAGKPDTAFALDTGRQVISLVAGLSLVLLAHPSITVLSFVYVAGFIPFAAITLPLIRGVRPELPERTRRTLAIVTEAIGGAGYAQGDIVLVGAFVSVTAAGYYSLASVVLWSIASVGQNYSFTFHEPLREHAGHVDAGPPLRISAALAIASGIGMAGAGVVMHLFGVDRDLWLCFVILAIPATTRFFSAVFATILALQSRDHLRMRISVACVALKAAGIVLLAGILDDGVVGAAIAFVVADFVAFAWAYLALYPKMGSGKAVER
ncbi:MAG: Polysaccharide biosynthesis associated protein [Marmoricola sp.]|nr:Polysaccharide biosynthesis associated protein [Marmoricola sp.]